MRNERTSGNNDKLESIEAQLIVDSFNGSFTSLSSLDGPISYKRINGPLILSCENDAPMPLAFDHCVFESGVTIYKCNCNSAISFADCVFKGDVFINGCKSTSNVIFLGGQIDGNLSLIDNDINLFHISLSCKDLDIASGNYKYLLVNGQKENEIRLLKVNFSQLTGVIEVSNIKVYQSKFTNNINKDTEFFFNKSLFFSIIIDAVTNNGKLKFFDLSPILFDGTASIFSITRSNLGKAEFVNLNFEEVRKTIIADTYLIDCIFVNVRWPRQFANVGERIFGFTWQAFFYPIRQLFEKKKRARYLMGIEVGGWLDLKETYRQLKYAYAKQGDAVAEHRFHGLEMNAQMWYLRKVRVSQWDENFFQRWMKHRQTSMVLWFSKWTSNFGQSFAAPLVTMAISGLVLFTWMVNIHAISALAPEWDFSSTQIYTTLANWLYFINPLRRYDIGEIRGWLIIDFIMRIISSYCIYNFIRATRRFVK